MYNSGAEWAGDPIQLVDKQKAGGVYGFRIVPLLDDVTAEQAYQNLQVQYSYAAEGGETVTRTIAIDGDHVYRTAVRVGDVQIVNGEAGVFYQALMFDQFNESLDPDQSYLPGLSPEAGAVDFYDIGPQDSSEADPDDETVMADMDGAKAFRVLFQAPSGQTLDAAGTLRAWIRERGNDAIYRQPDLDLQVGSTYTGGQQRLAFQAIPYPVGSGDLYYQTEGVGCSGLVQIFGVRIEVQR